MQSTRLVIVAVLAFLGLAVAGCGGSGGSTGGTYGTPPATSTASGGASGGSALDGTVGPGFEIQLSRDGEPVTILTPGTYTLTIDDQADSHDFHLTGPGVDVATDVSFTGTKTFTITVADGTYHFQCDPHASSMNGDFTVAG